MCHNEQSGFAEDWLHLGRVQARWATPKPLRLGHAQAREWLGMALDLFGALALHSVCTAFRDSNSVTNSRASRTQNQTELDYAEAKPALSALYFTHSGTSLENDFGSILIHPLALLFTEGCSVSASERSREGGTAF